MTKGNNQISPADGVDVSGGSKEQQAAGVGILLQIMMLVLSFVLGHVLRRKKIYVLPEASASLLIGLLGVVQLSRGVFLPLPFTSYNIISLTTRILLFLFAFPSFHHNYSLLSFLDLPLSLYSVWLQSLACKFFFLPFHSCFVLSFQIGLFTLHFRSLQKPFFSNFGAIVTFAIFGTFLASIVTGVLVYLGGLMYLMYRLPFVECLMFGALISATDPVTVLSIFQVM
ncbi:hypothetical protein ACSQ67_026149 [Phaseolus vulgaris]